MPSPSAPPPPPPPTDDYRLAGAELQRAQALWEASENSLRLLQSESEGLARERQGAVDALVQAEQGNQVLREEGEHRRRRLNADGSPTGPVQLIV